MFPPLSLILSKALLVRHCRKMQVGMFAHQRDCWVSVQGYPKNRSSVFQRYGRLPECEDICRCRRTKRENPS